jgi:hypothetical protein
VEDWGQAQRKKKGAKKKENGGLWKLTESTKTLSTVPTRPDDGSIEGLDSPAGWGQIKRSKGAKSS